MRVSLRERMTAVRSGQDADAGRTVNPRHVTLRGALDREALGRAVPRRALRRLIAAEARLALREPAGVVWGVGLPVLLMVIFGNIPKFNLPAGRFGGQSPLDVYLPILCTMVLAMLALFSIPVPLATYREQGVLRRMATTPVSPVAVLAAQLVVNLVLGAVAIGLILGIGTIAFGLDAPRQPFGFALALALTAVALFALGLWVAAIAKTGKAAQAIAGACFFPLEFLAGLWVPRQVMPAGLRDVSDYTPLGAAVQALQDSVNGTFPSARELLVLVAYAVGFGFAAVRMFSWE